MDTAERGEQDRTTRYPFPVRRVLIRIAIAVLCALALADATLVHTYHGTDNAGAYVDLFGHHFVVEWRGHPGFCFGCD